MQERRARRATAWFQNGSVVTLEKQKFERPSDCCRIAGQVNASMGADHYGCLVRADLRASLTDFVHERRTFPLPPERVRVVPIILSRDDQCAVAINVHLAGGGLRPCEIGVVVAAELVGVYGERDIGRPALPTIWCPKNSATLTNRNTS
jgi:hypothetical protein